MGLFKKNTENNTEPEVEILPPPPLLGDPVVRAPKDTGMEIKSAGGVETGVKKFLVRVGILPEVANKLVAEEINPVGVLLDSLKDDIVEICNQACYTFCAFYALAATSEECEMRIRQVWEEAFPGYSKAIQVMMIEADESVRTKVLQEIYCGYFGFDEYQQVCTTLARVLPPAKQMESMYPLRAMNYLVAIDDGCGFSTMLSSFGDFVSKLELLEKQSESVYEYRVAEDDHDGGETAKDIYDLLWGDEEKNTVIGLDISYYLPAEKAEDLRKFLKRLQRLQNDYVFLFRVPYLEKKALTVLEETMSDLVNIRTIKVQPYHEMILKEYSYNRASELHFQLDQNAEELILDQIYKEKQDSRFYGFRTMNKIMNEVIWSKFDHDVESFYCNREYDLERITAEDLNSLSGRKGQKKTGYEELAELIGMEEITKRLEEIVSQVLVAMKNDKMERPCLHMRFVGPPGTGKTTVARIVGKIFKEKGILKKGGFFEYAARSLVGEYIGQTAPKTQAICRDAYGSVLFIDEAYALYAGDSEKDYGTEALTTLIAEMENHRDDLVVILAGYTDEMNKLMEGNAGLRSRAPYVLEFNSYTREQLTQIFMKLVKKSFTYEDGFEEDVKAYFNKLSDSYMMSKEFANARFVRNLFERTWAKAAYRLAGMGEESNIMLLRSDFENASQEKEFSEKLMMEKKLGF